MITAPIQSTLFDDGILPLNHHAVQLPSFEGPLDLLLFLIKKNEIDIYDIPIETVTKQYLDILFNLEKLNLDISGEFLVMASTLMLIKSKMLLPNPSSHPASDLPDDNPSNDPRWELVSQLLDYQKLKEQSSFLASLISSKDQLTPRLLLPPPPSSPTQHPLSPIDSLQLWNAFNRILSQLSSRISTHTIHDDPLTISDKMSLILHKLNSSPSFLFSSLLPQSPSILSIVLSFLASLELSRLKKISLQQSTLFSDILISKLP